MIPEELPAVTVPSLLKTGRSLARTSAVVPGRGCSSVSTTRSSPFRWGMRTGTISSAKRPASMASAARFWLSAAKASWASRLTPNSSATTSAVWPRPMVHWSGSFGLAKRQPRTVSAVFGWPRE